MPCTSLYIHIPFCERKCPYCDFYSVAAEQARMDDYLNAVLRCLAENPFELSALDTVYFGGGTPSAMGGRRLAKLMNAIDARFSISASAEITVECNPHSSFAQELRLMRAAGINRLSFGMQSANDAQLAALGRLHTAAELSNAVKAAQQAGFSNLSLDLMLATPHQTLADIEAAIQLCDTLGASHVSAYLLKIEEGTPFAQNGVAAQCPDEDGQAEAYLHAVKLLSEHGYLQYEISNFAKAGRVGRHNLNYWNGGEYLGIGPSAHSFIGGKRFFFPRNLDAFLISEHPFSLIVEDGAGGDAEEYLMLRTRLSAGVVWTELQKQYPHYDIASLRQKARCLADSGLLMLDDTGFRLTAEGFLLSNSVIGALLA